MFRHITAESACGSVDHGKTDFKLNMIDLNAVEKILYALRIYNFNYSWHLVSSVLFKMYIEQVDCWKRGSITWSWTQVYF